MCICPAQGNTSSCSGISSGTVWASETLRLRHEDPLAFEVDELTPGSPQYSLGFRKCCARLHDDLFLYYDMTESDDLDKITGETESNCKFFTYEKERAKHLKFVAVLRGHRNGRAH